MKNECNPFHAFTEFFRMHIFGTHNKFDAISLSRHSATSFKRVKILCEDVNHFISCSLVGLNLRVLKLHTKSSQKITYTWRITFKQDSIHFQ